jgi:redox-sensitive bicupin YhaK (pirin superfamily)
MQKVVHRASERGIAEHEWLHSRFSFSFAEWYEPTRMGFGALRVINDDIIDSSSGFGMHPHRDMEIVTIVMEGTVTHQDSLGNVGHTSAGDVQVMSAGTGVVHSEYNESPDSALKLFQIWIVPHTRGIEPRYEQMSFGAAKGGIEVLVGPEGTDAPLTMYQDAYVARGVLKAGESLDYAPKVAGNGVYLFVVSGTVTVAGEVLNDRDAVGAIEPGTLTLAAQTDAQLLIFEVPM